MFQFSLLINALGSRRIPQKRSGTLAHAHLAGIIPDGVVMAEASRAPSTSGEVAAYLRKLVLKMLMHNNASQKGASKVALVK